VGPTSSFDLYSCKACLEYKVSRYLGHTEVRVFSFLATAVSEWDRASKVCCSLG